MLKVSAIIPTRNEVHNIEAAIGSVKWADEIIVIDSFSTDGTPELAHQLGAKVFQRKFDTHARQKNHAIAHATHNWIFILDADERTTPVLIAEIKGLLASEPPFAAYWIRRQNYFMGQRVRYSGWQRDKVIRLFRKDACQYQDKQIHEEIETQGPVGKLKNKLRHYTYRNLKQYLEKWDHYSWQSVKDHAGKTPEVSLYHLWFKPSFSFFRHYVLQGGFMDGKVGFIISYMAATTVFMRYLKLWRLQEDQEKSGN